MYSYEERMNAVELNIKYERSVSSTIQQLGYPSPQALRNWFSEFQNSGDLQKTAERKKKFSQSEKQLAVNHYLEYGRNYSRTIRMLGYPNR